MLSRPSTALALALVLGLSVSACGGDDGSAKRPAASPGTPTTTARDPTPSPSPSETPNKPPVEKPVEPPFQKGEAGQEAFARYVVDAWAYSLATNDMSVLREISADKKGCAGCQQQATELAQRKKEGWSVYPFDVAVDKVRLIKTALGTTARVRMDIPATRSYFDDGTFRNDSPPHEGTVFTVSMKPSAKPGEKRYRLVGFTIG